MNTVKVKCPAKINLSLKVIGKRSDGFHNIESIMQTINLFDFLTINIEESEIEEIILNGDNSEIPYDETNLVYKAAKLFLDTYKKNKFYKISIFIEKNIPVAAGLAGGSTDAAGTLYGLNELLARPFTSVQLHNLCSKLGSDLNVCMQGGRILAKGRGEILETQDYKEFSLSIIKPENFGISAKEAYTKFSLKNKNDASRIDFVNDLEWALIDDYKELQYIKSKYPNSVMTGSGSAYYQIDSKYNQEKGFVIINDLKSVPYGVCEY